MNFKECQILVGEITRVVDESALSHIQDDSYGKCLRCDGDIQFDRLRIYPEAKYCVECQERVESNRLP